MGFGVDRTGSDNGVSGIGGSEPDYDSHSSSDDHSRSDFDRLQKAATGTDVYEGQSHGDSDDNTGNEKSFFEKVSDFFTRPEPSHKDRPSSMKLSEFFTDPTLSHTTKPAPKPSGLVQTPKSATDQAPDESYAHGNQSRPNDLLNIGYDSAGNFGVGNFWDADNSYSLENRDLSANTLSSLTDRPDACVEPQSVSPQSPPSMKLGELFTDPTLSHTSEPAPYVEGFIQAPDPM